MPADTHIHTPLCKHATGEPDAYVRSAVEKGLPAICFTDHCPVPDGYDPKHRMAMDEFDIYRQKVSAAAKNVSIPVRFGVEADYYPGCESFLASWLPAQKLDLVIGAIHYIRDWGFDDPATRSLWRSVSVADTWREYFQLVGRLADSGLYDVVGHIDLPKKFGYRPDVNAIEEMASPALDRVSKAGMAVEINTSGLRKPVGEIYPSEALLRLARARGIPICFGSDAHHPDLVGADFDQAVLLARTAGYTHYAEFAKREKHLTPLSRGPSAPRG